MSITTGINMTSITRHNDIITGTAEQVEWTGTEYTPVSDEYTFSYNIITNHLQITSQNKNDILKILDLEDFIENMNDNAIPNLE